MSYDRRHIANDPTLKGKKIHPAFCVGRENNSIYDEEYNFAIKFFKNCSSHQLATLFELANNLYELASKQNINLNEISIQFWRRKGKENFPYFLSKEEMEKSNFSLSSWSVEVTPLDAPKWDELREIQEYPFSIVFH